MSQAIGIYAFYKKESKKGCYLGFFIDQMPYSRRSGVENHWEFHTRRKLSKVEQQEVEGNKDCWTRRFKVWMYKDIDRMIYEDRKYNVRTPQEFIDEAIKRGFKLAQQSFDF